MSRFADVGLKCKSCEGSLLFCLLCPLPLPQLCKFPAALFICLVFYFNFLFPLFCFFPLIFLFPFFFIPSFLFPNFIFPSFFISLILYFPHFSPFIILILFFCLLCLLPLPQLCRSALFKLLIIPSVCGHLLTFATVMDVNRF